MKSKWEGNEKKAIPKQDHDVKPRSKTVMLKADCLRKGLF